MVGLFEKVTMRIHTLLLIRLEVFKKPLDCSMILKLLSV